MTDTSFPPPCDEVDGRALMEHARALARWVKLSGTREEAESLRYVQAQLEKSDFRTKTILHDAYVSLPGAASVEVDGQTIRAITQSFSRPAPATGLPGALVHVGAGGDQDFAGLDLRGRIVLVDGIATPGVAQRASAAGAAGQIHISPHEHLHEMCISPVWGSPTLEEAGRLPSTVVCTIGETDGAALLRLTQAGGSPLATLHAAVDTGWRKTPILVADMDAPGAGPDGPFVLFSGHHDTWHYGVMDNGTANATMLELARLAARHRHRWQRGLRLCFWSGHSHGRFSGSTWYADEHWDELDRSCVAHVNVDSPGAAGAENLANTGAMTELASLAAEALRQQAGQDFAGARMPRGADMSFSGIGVPAIFGDMSEPWSSPVLPHSWWWHTPEDLLDKIDEQILVRDAQVCMHGLWRLLTNRILPLDYAAYAGALIDELTRVQNALGNRLSLEPLITGAERLQERAKVLVEAAGINQALMRVSRALVPIAYSAGDRFGHDPALPQPAWPSLQPLRALAAANAGSEGAKFLAVAATRCRNRIMHALRRANDALAAVHP